VADGSGKRRWVHRRAESLNLSLTRIGPASPPSIISARRNEMWIDFAIFLLACQILTFSIIRIVEAAG
jgi:hypothetical protein